VLVLNYNDPASARHIKLETEAFIAGWIDERNHNPLIKDNDLLTSWNEYLRKSFKKEPITGEMVTKFLRRYRNPEWIVYTDTFEPAHESIGSFTVWLVVLADTIIE
jgi:hypothetical protein